MDTTLDDSSDGSTDTQDDLAVSLDSLALDGTNPGQGDSVDVQVTGTISKIVNGTAFVKPVTVNGEPVQADKPATEPTDDELMAAAQKSDMNKGIGY